VHSFQIREQSSLNIQFCKWKLFNMYD